MRAFDEKRDVGIEEMIGWAQQALGEAGIEAPRREARLLLAAALRCSGDEFLLSSSRRIEVQEPEIARFRQLVGRRCGREPMAYILGRQGFWTLDLEVSGATLIPRADSESVIELLVQLRPDRTVPLRILDLGTGTGCLLLAALSEYPRAWGVGTDLSAAAALLAARNAAANGLSGRSSFLCGVWSDGLREEVGRGFDVVLSNPPYIASAEIVDLMPEVACFEPALALDGGPDGLACYRTILASLPRLLAADGIAIAEIGATQHDKVAALADGCGLVAGPARPDLSGVRRALCVRRS